MSWGSGLTRKELAETLKGLTISHVETTRPFGDMNGNAETIRIMFTDGSKLFVDGIGYDSDGIGYFYEPKP